MRAVAPLAQEPDYRPLLVELEEPRPGPDEVLVEVRATALNRADLLQLRGLYPPPPGEPEPPGLECAGVVLAAGAEVTGWQRGDRVMALLGGGGHAERVAVPAGQLLAVPDGFSWAEAAALPEAALTAWTNLVVEGELRRGETVVITGASGGVGSYAVQLAAELGTTVVAVGRDPERLAPLRGLGADHLLRDDGELPGALRRAIGRGADLVFDTVSGPLLPSHLAAVLRRRLRLIGSVLRSRPRPEKARLVSAFAEFAADRLAAGRLRPVVARSFPFDRIADAYAAMEAGGLLGKIVVERPTD